VIERKNGGLSKKGGEIITIDDLGQAIKIKFLRRLK